MLSTRILTALVGIPLIFVCIYFGSIPFYLLMFIVSFFCVKEYLVISKKYNPHSATSLAMSVVFFLFLYFFDMFPYDKVAISAIIMMFVFFFIEVFGENPNLSVGRINVSFFGSFFIPLSLMHMVYIRNLCNGMKLIFFIFIVVWVLDTAAYAFGIMFGKHKLAKNVSPKKTIEGAVAGIIFGMLTAYLCRYIFMKYVLTTNAALMVGLVIAVTGQFSDLAESLIKRDGDIKDSGKIIPGHGGVFDRFDSYIFASPAVYYVLQILR
ncbi:MAG: phosphatidate cytidylyltransferase [Endomicrobium sp.]|nr:phosphatidate cytidylyltransferase [Endomicrobium sp.]